MHCLFVLGEALTMRLLKADRRERTVWLLLSLHFRANIFEAQPTEKNSFSQETEENTVLETNGIFLGQERCNKHLNTKLVRKYERLGVDLCFYKDKGRKCLYQRTSKFLYSRFQIELKHENERSDICLQTNQHDNSV